MTTDTFHFCLVAQANNLTIIFKLVKSAVLSGKLLILELKRKNCPNPLIFIITASIFADFYSDIYNVLTVEIMGKIIGIDLGSTAAKAVVLNGKVLASAIKPTGSNLMENSFPNLGAFI